MRTKLGPERTRWTSKRRAGLCVVGGGIASVALAAASFACTASPSGGYLEVNPPTGNSWGRTVFVQGACPDSGCTYNTADRNIYLDNLKSSTIWQPRTTLAAQTTCSGPATGDTAIGVTTTADPVIGSGTLVQGGRTSGVYIVCSGLNPQRLWNYVGVL